MSDSEKQLSDGGYLEQHGRENKNGRSQAYMLRVKYADGDKWIYYDSPKHLAEDKNITISMVINAVKFSPVILNVTIRNKFKDLIHFDVIEKLPLIVNGICIKQQRELTLPVIKLLFECDDGIALKIWNYDYMEKQYDNVCSS